MSSNSLENSAVGIMNGILMYLVTVYWEIESEWKIQLGNLIYKPLLHMILSAIPHATT